MENSIVKVFEFEFEGRTTPVRVDMFDGNPWWVAKDVVRALGYSVVSDTNSLTAHIPAEWKGTKPFVTPGGVQEMICISRQGLVLFLQRSDKRGAKKFQEWIAGDVVPSIMDTGTYSLPEKRAEIELLAANELRFERIEAQLVAINEDRQQALADLYRMESPKVAAKSATTRKKIWWMVMCYCRAHRQSLSVSWGRFYDAVLVNLDVDLRQRWRKEKEAKGTKARSALALAEELEKTQPGLMEQLYAQAYLHFGVGKAKSMAPLKVVR
jgi:prophage antirepressor-like protein